MPEITFDPTEANTEQEAAQARALEVGEKLINEQEAAAAAGYQKAREDEASELRYAGKFKSAEDLEKAYKELQKKLGEAKGESSEDSAEGEEAEGQADEQESTEEEGSPVVDLLTKASNEFYEGDTISEETLNSLKELSSEELVNAYVEMQKTANVPKPITTEQADALIKDVGGQDGYQQTLQWAADNLTAEEVAAYDQVINTGSLEAVKFAMQALSLRAKYEGGFEGTQVSGKAVKNQGPKGFKSQAELARAIGDRRYQSDPAYRLEIQERLANSGDLL